MDGQPINITVTVCRNDDMEAFGAYHAPFDRANVNDSALVVLNIEAMLGCHAQGDYHFKDNFIEAVMHEVGHALEQRLDLPFDEERIEKIIAHWVERAHLEDADG